MPALIDLTNKTFGRWKVLHSVENKGWMCRCRCGTTKIVKSAHLRYGCSTRCSLCRTYGSNLKHGAVKGKNSSRHFPLTYKVWRSMRARCLGKNAYYTTTKDRLPVRICKRWMAYENFLKDMGPRPSKKHSIHRKNNNGHYTPKNCVWATRVEQVRGLPQNQKGYKHKTRYGEPRCQTL